MAVYLCPVSTIFQWFDDNGVILSGGKVNTYLAGTTTPQATYTDSTGVTPNANPLILGPNGRLQNVQIWQPQSVALKIVFTDKNNVQLGPIFDQLTGIDDPTSSLSLYNNPTSGFGVDLVANAMRSYDIFSSLRAANVPVLSAGQTLVVDVEGANLVTDTGGGLFYWNPASTATDDGANVIKPTAINPVNPGRYLRQAQSGFAGIQVVTFVDISGNPTANCPYYVIGNTVVMRVPQLNGTSTSTSNRFSFSNPYLVPTAAQVISIAAARDNGVALYAQVGFIDFNLGITTISLAKNGSNIGWTASGNKGIGDGGGGQYSNVLTWLRN
jgi:hypothetical protein